MFLKFADLLIKLFAIAPDFTPFSKRESAAAF